MKNRYWTPTDPPEALLDWVEENVVRAERDFWEREGVFVSCEVNKGKCKIIITGPPKVTKSDPTGGKSYRSAKFDLVQLLKEEVDWRGFDPEWAADVRKVAENLRALADRMERRAAKPAD